MGYRPEQAAENDLAQLRDSQMRRYGFSVVDGGVDPERDAQPPNTLSRAERRRLRAAQHNAMLAARPEPKIYAGEIARTERGIRLHEPVAENAVTRRVIGNARGLREASYVARKRDGIAACPYPPVAYDHRELTPRTEPMLHKRAYPALSGPVKRPLNHS